jgi:hypothetical protein
MCWAGSRCRLSIGAGREACEPFEEPVEIAGITKAQTVADLLDREFGLLQPLACFLQQPFMDEAERRCAHTSQTGVMQMRPRHTEQAGEFVDTQTLTIVEFDELPEALNRIGAGAAQMPRGLEPRGAPQMQQHDAEMQPHHHGCPGLPIPRFLNESCK